MHELSITKSCVKFLNEHICTQRNVTRTYVIKCGMYNTVYTVIRINIHIISTNSSLVASNLEHEMYLYIITEYVSYFKIGLLFSSFSTLFILLLHALFIIIISLFIVTCKRNNKSLKYSRIFISY